MKEKVSEVRKAFKSLEKQHLGMMKASDDVVSTSNEAHIEILKFCAEFAPHLLKNMHEIDRDVSIFISRTCKVDSLFQELKKHNDTICLYCVKKNYDPNILNRMLDHWDAIFTKYEKNSKDVDEWLQSVVVKWAEYEKEVMKCAE